VTIDFCSPRFRGTRSNVEEQLSIVTSQSSIQQLVVVGDAHLGAVPAEVEGALLELLDRVPVLGDGLLINGDLFDFWFAWRRAIPRGGFRVASALTQLARRIPVYMTGGNHDRWGDSFWDRDAGIRFGAEGIHFQVGSIEAFAIHGDGLAEQHWSGKMMPGHAEPDHGARPAAGFRLLVGDRLREAADSTRDAAVLDRAALAGGGRRAGSVSIQPRDCSSSVTPTTALKEFGTRQWYRGPARGWMDSAMRSRRTVVSS
jgi:hypothetical protein